MITLIIGEIIEIIKLIGGNTIINNSLFFCTGIIVHVHVVYTRAVFVKSVKSN